MGIHISTQSNRLIIRTGAGDGDDLVFIFTCSFFCFHEQTMINVLEKDDKIMKKKVSDIKIGDRVLTYNGGKTILTNVIKNVENKGSYEFYEFKCRNKDSIKSITVTGNHTMIIYSKDNYKIQLKLANQTKIGDLFRTTDGMYEIFEINKKRMNRSYELRVENGTVLANDILISTLYLRNNDNVKEYHKIIESSKIPVENMN